MANLFYVAPTVNYPQSTLNGAINSGAATITISSTANIQAPGFAVIDREDSNGTATPSARELITFTGVSGNDLTGCTRGADQSTARAHNDGAIIEFVPTVGMWNSLTTIVATALTSDGSLKALISPMSISLLHITTRVSASGASVTTSDLSVSRYLNVSGTSITGSFPIHPLFVIAGSVSGATTAVGAVLPMPQAGNFKWVTVTSRFPVSTSSLVIDINKNGSSLFQSATRPAIAAGGTFLSTASLNTKAFTAGDVLSVDVAAAGTDGFSRDISVLLRGE